MGQRLNEIIKCCQDCTTTAKEFIDDIGVFTDYTLSEMMKNRQMAHTITKRQWKERK